MVFVIWGIVLGMFAVFSLRSRKEQGSILQRVSVHVYKKLSVLPMTWKRLHRQNTQLTQNLVSLHPGEMPERLLADYHVEKIRMVILILLMGSGIACCTELAVLTGGIVKEGGTIHRPTERKTFVLEAKVNDDEGVMREKIELEVNERVLTAEEAQIRYEELILILEQDILGENPSLQEVRENLNLPYEVEDYPFSINWKSSDHGLLASDGSVTTGELQAPAEINLTAEVFYGEMEWVHSWDIILYPPERTAREQFIYEMRTSLKEAEEEQKYEEELQLPQSVDGRVVLWAEKKESSGSAVLLITVLAAGIVFCMKDKDLQDELIKRRRAMKQEYVVIVSKYALFLEAGMTVRGAFVKICRDYYEKEHVKINPLYEEMRYSCNELKAGISESKVYENFGRRTGVQEYTRLCALLTQNLKKGNTALTRRLKEECDNAFTESLQWRKRRGEEAGTKLLAPMGMMLVMVLIMIMLPAFFGLGI